MIMTYALLWLVTSAPTCRLMGVPLSRDSGFTYFIATALPDTLRATAGTGPTRYGFTPMSASNPGGLLPPPAPDSPVFGQLVRLDRVGGFGQDKIQRYLASGRRDALLIPWGYQANCSPVLWEASARWVNPGAVGFFLAQLRPDSEWIGGRPTFDIGAAWHQPYPQGEFLKYDRERNDSSQELTVSELWDLYETLPSPELLETNAARAIEPTRQWARAHPGQARRWPATRILQFLEFSANRERR